jgi:hypothetical protein
MCARFINEDDSYQPDLTNKIMKIEDTDEREKQIDDYSQKKAKSYLQKYIKNLR